jgi:hypothetical protein
VSFFIFTKLDLFEHLLRNSTNFMNLELDPSFYWIRSMVELMDQKTFGMKN